MISALILQTGPQTAPTLVPDLQAAGIAVKGALETGGKLVQAVAQYQPDVLICDVAVPDKALWKALHNLDQTLPCPVLLFTDHQDAKAMAEASSAGVHVYAVLGYEARRLRALVQLAQARFAHAQEQRQAFEDLSTRFEERKTVDRAKGILMQARQVSDDDAFALLRSAAMRSKQRLGQLSQHIIQSAQAADVLNRAGQLRMLSQRLVKLHLLQAAGVQVTQQAALLQASEQRVQANLALLRKTLSTASITILSDKSTASSTSCVTMTTVLWVRATISSSSSCSLARVNASSAPKGSSMSKTLGSMARALAMPTRCFMPPEISPGRFCAAAVRPTSARAASERAISCALFSDAAPVLLEAAPKTRSTPRYTFSKQVSQGSSEWFWNTTARSGPGPAISRLAHSKWPWVGRVRPAIRFNKVDLPQPLWPIKATNSPLATVRLMPCSAGKEPFLVLKVWSTPWTSMNLACIASTLMISPLRM
jgi:AmiR/NasT family two-component response regulator